MSPTQKKIESAFVFLGALVVTVLAAVVLMEFTARQFFPQVTPHRKNWLNDKAQVPRPYVMSAASTTLKGINPLGYSGKLPHLPKPKGEIRVAVLGASMVFGSSPSKPEDLIPLLEKELQKKGGRRVKVYNFGIPESTARQNLNRLVLDILPTQPDIVVSLGGGTDMTSLESRVGYPTRFAGYEANPLWSFDIRDYPLLKMTLMGSQIFRKLYDSPVESLFSNRIFRPGFFSPQPELSWTREKPLNYSNALVMMERISRIYKAEFVAFFQPHWDHNPDFFQSPPQPDKWLNKVNAYLARHSPNIAFTSLFGLFDSEAVPENNKPRSSEYHAILAKELAKVLQERFPSQLIYNYEGKK